MLQFDRRGNLEPYQPISSNIDELKAYFVDGIVSKTRQDNFEKYIKYSDELKALASGTTLKQWVNGSFVTKKLNPKDVDLITFLDYSIIKKLGSKLNNFSASNSWDIYGVDAYIIEVHPKSNILQYNFTKADTAEWLYLFSHTRINRRGLKFMKGFIEINY